MRLTTLALAAALLVLPAGAQAQSTQTSASASSSSQGSSASDAFAEYAKPDCKDRALLQPRLYRMFPKGGQVTIDCTITPDGSLTSCKVVKSQPADPKAGELVADSFLCYAHVDPKAIANGLLTNGRKKFTFRWDADPNKDMTFLN